MLRNWDLHLIKCSSLAMTYSYIVEEEENWNAHSENAIQNLFSL